MASNTVYVYIHSQLTVSGEQFRANECMWMREVKLDRKEDTIYKWRNFKESTMKILDTR